MYMPRGGPSFTVTLRLKGSWPWIAGGVFEHLETAVRSASLSSSNPDVEWVAIGCRSDGTGHHWVPWPAVQDVAATLALEESGAFAAKYVILPSSLEFTEQKGLSNRQEQTERSFESYFHYDRSAPGPLRPTVTFFEYDAPPARRWPKPIQ